MQNPALPSTSCSRQQLTFIPRLMTAGVTLDKEGNSPTEKKRQPPKVGTPEWTPIHPAWDSSVGTLPSSSTAPEGEVRAQGL